MKDSESAALTQAYLRGVSLLAQRDHSSVELERKLSVKGYSSAQITEAIGRLISEGYLDDRRFALRWAESAIRSGRGFGIRILKDLLQRGVSRELAEEAVRNTASEYPENESLAALVAKRFSAFDPSSAPQKERQRVYSYLQRRGFSLQSITGFFKSRTEEFER